jgi:hypothetical protein
MAFAGANGPNYFWYMFVDASWTSALEGRSSRTSHFLTRVRFHFTPTYSSWLNQVEIWFAKIDRDAIARGVFTSVGDLSRKLMKYIRHYAKSAKPSAGSTPTSDGG